MSNSDTTLPMAQPPISSSTGTQPQETLLLRGAFDPPVIPGTLGRLDRFEILRLLGEGGMGQVYLAREPRTDTRVAVKILRPQMADDPQAVHRFLTEARHMYRLSHPRILRVLEVSDRQEGPFYVMPYIEGGSLLGQYNPGRPMPTERILTIASQVAEALAHAHAHGLIHRDLKPGNVLLEKDGNAYLTDFGLVRTVFNDSMVDTSASHLEGTAPYMSPAVARGEAEDTRCDIYAFGALLYELLTSQPPYTGRTPQIILDQVLKGPPPPIREVNPKASPALVKIAEGCMARELRDRYASMADVVSDLDRAAKGQVPFGPHRQQHRLPRLAALLAATLTFAALAGVAVHHFSAGTRSTHPQQTGVQSPASGVLDQMNATVATDQTHASLYMVVDLSGGTNAASYPVTYLDAIPAGGWTDEYRADKLVLRRIEPGTFVMGSLKHEGGSMGEEAQRKVTLTKPFFIGVFEVTQRQWELVTGIRPSRFKGANLPVESVSYNDIRGSAASMDAASFMALVRAKTRIETFDLPTGTQWEYACRAETDEPNGQDLDVMTWYYKNSGNTTCPVGQKRPNAWGLYDMYGNVWEWCLDRYVAADLGDGAAIDPAGTASASSCILRGGCWSGSAGYCRSVSRINSTPSSRNGNYGFRVCVGVDVSRVETTALTSSTASSPPNVPGASQSQIQTFAPVERTELMERAKVEGDKNMAQFSKEEITKQQMAPQVQSQTMEQSPDTRAIAEVLRVGGMFWTSSNRNLPQRGESRTTPDPSQPLFRAFLDRTSITDDSLQLFAGLSQLNGLYLQGTHVTDAGLSHLDNLPKLENLYLHYTQISDAGLVYLKQLPSLQVLFLEGTKVTDTGLEILGNLKNLDRLSLSGTKITDAGLKYLGNLSKLNGFYVEDTAVGDAVTELARKLPNLGIIYLGRTRITDAGLANLKDLTQLDMVVLSGTKITDAGLKHLSGLTRLDRLLLDDTPVSDAGLKHLTDLSALTVLSLNGTKATEAGISEFQKSHPHCHVFSSFETGSLRRLASVTPSKLAEPAQFQFEKLEVKRVSNGDSLGAGVYKYVPDNRAHSMLLELQPTDLSSASEIRFEINKDEAYGPIKITLRDYGNLISDSVDITKFIQGNRDGYQAVRIPADAFKTRGWNMQSVKLLFIGDQTLRDAGGPSFSIRAIEAGFTIESPSKIVEGEGWRGFRVGATSEELIKELGSPDADSNSKWLKWKKYSVHCLVDDNRGAFELRFDDGFKGETTAGVGIGSTLIMTLAAYGEPTTQEDKGRAKNMTWTSKGILIWFHEDKVNQIVVFQKK